MMGCRWLTHHLTVHTVIMHMNKKTNKLNDNVLVLGTENDSMQERERERDRDRETERAKWQSDHGGVRGKSAVALTEESP